MSYEFRNGGLVTNQMENSLLNTELFEFFMLQDELNTARFSTFKPQILEV